MWESAPRITACMSLDLGLDIPPRRWLHPTFITASVPGHDGTHEVAIQNKIWMFGWGNRLPAPNDVWDSGRRRRRLAGKDKASLDVATGVSVDASQPRCIPSLVLAFTLVLTHELARQTGKFGFELNLTRYTASCRTSEITNM